MQNKLLKKTLYLRQTHHPGRQLTQIRVPHKTKNKYLVTNGGYKNDAKNAVFESRDCENLFRNFQYRVLCFSIKKKPHSRNMAEQRKS